MEPPASSGERYHSREAQRMGTGPGFKLVLLLVLCPRPQFPYLQNGAESVPCPWEVVQVTCLAVGLALNKGSIEICCCCLPSGVRSHDERPDLQSHLSIEERLVISRRSQTL